MPPVLRPAKPGEVKDKMAGSHDFSPDLCLKCTICNTVCPVYAVNPDFPGPKYLGPELVRLGESLPKNRQGADACAGCRQCELACPNGVRITHLIHEAKARGGKKKGIPFRDWMLGHNQLVSGLASRLPGMANLLFGSAFFRSMAEKFFGIKNRPFPRYQKAFSFPAVPLEEGDLKVAYFTGCYSRFNEPGIAQSTLRLLEKCGVRVLVPPQRCCGVPMIANGLIEEGKKNARFNLEILAGLVDRGYLVVTSCPSCALSLKQEYGDFFQLPQAEKVGKRVYDIFEFLLHYGLLEKGKFSPLKKHYFYHQPCHTKAQGIGSPALKLLDLIPQLIIVAGEQKCCGQAGTYGFKKEKYDTSLAIAGKLFQDVADSGADGVVTECGMCSLQLAGGTGKEVWHPVELLDRSFQGINGHNKE